MSDDPHQLFNVGFEGERTDEVVRALKRVGARNLATAAPPSTGPHIVQLRANTSRGAVRLVQSAVGPHGKFANFRVAASAPGFASRIEGVHRKPRG